MSGGMKSFKQVSHLVFFDGVSETQFNFLKNRTFFNGNPRHHLFILKTGLFQPSFGIQIFFILHYRPVKAFRKFLLL